MIKCSGPIQIAHVTLEFITFPIIINYCPQNAWSSIEQHSNSGIEFCQLARQDSTYVSAREDSCETE